MQIPKPLSGITTPLATPLLDTQTIDEPGLSADDQESAFGCEGSDEEGEAEEAAAQGKVMKEAFGEDSVQRFALFEG